MAVRKFGRSWWVDFRFNNIRVRKRSPENSCAGAHAYELILRQRLSHRGRLARDETKASTFANFVDRWLRDYVDVNNKPSERATKRRILASALLPEFGTLRLSEITSSRIEHFKAGLLARNLSPKTVNNVLAVLRKCLVSACDWEELGAIPRFKPLKTFRSPVTTVTEEELQRVLGACHSTIWRTMVLVTARTGMRFSEVSALRWTDVNFAERSICVQRARVIGILGSPKSGKLRYVYPTTDALVALMALSKSASSDFVFHHRGRPVSHSGARKQLQRACIAADVQRIGWHALRHTYATELVTRGAPLVAVQRLLGHSTIQMTERYSHPRESFLRAAVALLESQR